MSLSYLPGFSKRPLGYSTAQIGLHSVRNIRFLPKTAPKFQADVLELSGQPVQTSGETVIPWSEHLVQLRKVQAHAQKAQRFLPNFSNRHYGAMVVLNNGVEGLGTNVETSRKSTFCDLRYAVASAMNQFIVAAKDAHEGSKDPSKDIGGDEKSPNQKNPTMVKTVYLTNANLNAEPPVPCSDCQSWLGSHRYFSPDTQVISLELSSSDKLPLLRSRTVKDLLPLHHGRDANVRMTTDKSFYQLPVKMSESAQKVLKEKPNVQHMARMLMKQAKQGILKAEATYQKEAKLPMGAAVLLSPSELMNRQNTFSWSNRWTEPADLRAAANALERVEWRRHVAEKLPGLLQGLFKSWLAPQKVKAIAYYGNEPELPPIANLGRIARKNKDSNTLVITVENDVIQVRTIQDYMPEMYYTRTS